MFQPPGEARPESGADVDPRLRSARLFADVPRLEQQLTLTWQAELRVLQRLGLADRMRVLDLGCGPGFVTQELLRLLPSSPVVAVDLDPLMTAQAVDLVQVAAGRALVLTCSALNIDVDDECVDFAIARFLFQHLTAPDLAAGEAYRVLCPGGQLAIIDIDESLGGIIDPPIPSLSVLGQRVAELQASRGGNRHIGRELWRLLQQAGFEDLAVNPILVHSDDIGVEPFLPHYQPERYLQFVTSGAIPEVEWERYRDDFEAFLAAPRPYIAHLLLIVSGRKPPASSPEPQV